MREAPWVTALMPQFLKVSASRLAEIETERSKLETCPDPREVAKAIGDVAHKISGTAETLGFVALGRQASTTEDLCVQYARLTSLPAAIASKGDLDLHITNLISELRRILPTPADIPAR